VIGDNGSAVDAPDAGTAILYTTQGQRVLRFSPASPIAGAFFGSAVAVEDNNVLVGAERTPTRGTQAGEAFFFDIAAGCNPADIALPISFIDLSDVDAFIGAFTTADPAADLVAPFGIVDLDDVNAFITSFLAGCP